MRKLKAVVCINLGLYRDIRPEIEIDAPDGLANKELVLWLEQEYGGLLDGKKQFEKHNELVNEVARNARRGIPTPVEKYVEATENDPEAAHLINENKKAYNRDVYEKNHPKKDSKVEEKLPTVQLE